MITFRTWFDMSRPCHDCRNPDSTLMQETFAPSIFRLEKTATVEPGRITSTVECGSVVGSENNKCILIQIFFFQFFYQSAYLFIKIADHCCIGGVWITAGQITRFACIGFFVTELFYIILHPTFRSLQGYMWQGSSPHQEERSGLIGTDEFQKFIED